MTVQSVTAVNWEMPNWGADGERTYVVTYLVRTDDPLDGPITVGTAASVPAINSSFSYGNDFDAGAFARNFTCNLVNPSQSLTLWHVRITYSSEATRRNDPNKENDPVQQAAIISGGGVRFSRIVEELADGSPLVNSANDLVTGVEMDDDRASLRIQKNFQTIDLDQYAQFANTVNLNTFFGLSARKWKLSHPRWEQRFRGSGTPYYTVTFEFESKSDTWDISPYDRGHFYLDASGNRKRFEANGIILTSPQNLDGGGGQLAANIEPVKIQGGGLEIYQKKDFALLGIPTAL